MTDKQGELLPDEIWVHRKHGLLSGPLEDAVKYIRHIPQPHITEEDARELWTIFNDLKGAFDSYEEHLAWSTYTDHWNKLGAFLTLFAKGKDDER